MSFEEGKAKNLIAPEAFEVLGHYTYTSANPAQQFGDSWSAKPVNYAYTDGEKANPGQSQIEGYIVKFRSLAKE